MNRRPRAPKARALSAAPRPGQPHFSVGQGSPGRGKVRSARQVGPLGAGPGSLREAEPLARPAPSALALIIRRAGRVRPGGRGAIGSRRERRSGVEVRTELLGPTRARLLVRLGATDLREAEDRVMRRLSATLKVPGFRPGRIPAPVIEARLGRRAVAEEVREEALGLFLPRAIEAEGLAAVGPASVKVSSFEDRQSLEFQAEVDVKPEVVLPDLSSLEVEAPSTEPEPGEVEAALERLRERFGRLQPVSRPAARGDFVLMDIRAYQHDQEVPGTSARDLGYLLGSEMIVPELDRALEGARSGDILKFNAVLPPGFGEWAGREVTFQVLVKEVKERVLPPLDDDFARTASEFETVEELKADIYRRIREVKEERYQRELERRALSTLLEAVEVPLPESMVERELDYRSRRFGAELGQVGIDLDEYTRATGRTPEEVREGLREEARVAVKARLLLEELARQEQIEVSEEEVEEEIARRAEARGAEPDEYRRELERRGALGLVAGDIILSKALQVLASRVTVKGTGAGVLQAREEGSAPEGKA